LGEGGVFGAFSTINRRSGECGGGPGPGGDKSPSRASGGPSWGWDRVGRRSPGGPFCDISGISRKCPKIGVPGGGPLGGGPGGDKSPIWGVLAVRGPGGGPEGGFWPSGGDKSPSRASVGAPPGVGTAWDVMYWGSALFFARRGYLTGSTIGRPGATSSIRIYHQFDPHDHFITARILGLLGVWVGYHNCDVTAF